MKEHPALLRVVVRMLPSLERGRRIDECRYMPHLVVGDPNQRVALLGKGNRLLENYLGVRFCSGPPELLPGQEHEAVVSLLYGEPGDDFYAELVPGATFTVREGGTVVGFGYVVGPEDSA